MTQYMTASPNPVHVGQSVTICYDFYSAGNDDEVLLNVVIDGVGGMSLKLDPNTPCETITVPTGCTSILLEDHTGPSNDLLITVLP